MATNKAPVIEVYSDLSNNPSLDNLGDMKKVINEDAIKQSIRTIINTPKGSRLFEPDFGCNINDFLFSTFNSNTALKIGKEIEYNLTTYETRISLIGIEVTMLSTVEGYSISIIYEIKDIQKQNVITIQLQRL